MRNQTAAELIEGIAQAGVALTKEVYTRRQERKQMEREAEMRREMIELEADTSKSSGEESAPETVESVLDQAVETSERYDDLLRKAESKEDCQLCRALISQAREKPLPQQRKLIPELREFISKIEDDAPKDELIEAINQNAALKGLLQEHMSAVQEAADPGSGVPAGDKSSSRRRSLSRGDG